MSRPVLRQLGKIKCLDQLSKTDSDSHSQKWVILFHGYGADAYDLYSLAEVLSLQNTNWLFPQGVLEVPIGPGWTGRAWWNIDIETLQRRQLQGESPDLSHEKPERLAELRKKIMAMIAELKVDWSQIVLGGFSQGSMLATDIFLHAPQAPKGLMILSGALVNKEEWKTVVKNRAGSEYFLCHGTHDPVLPYRSSQQLEGFLNGSGLKGKLFSFNGGHEIPPEAIFRANEYLKGL